MVCPRYLAHRRSELIAAVRREQRLELAQDLHDFVAHDLTGIVAQAQAAQFARADDVDHLRGALERIEHVGVAALDAMDGLVQVLHDGDAAPLWQRRIGDVPALVERFRAERGPGAPVRVELDDDLQARVPRQLQATAYRVVVEGLTNVRRHAAPGGPVTVSVSGTPDGSVSVAVLNDGGAAPSDRPRRARGGTGLDALRERLSAAGGRLEAGPDGTGRWRLHAMIADPRTSACRVIVVTTFDLDEYVTAALALGACGFLPKRSGPALVTEAIRAADNGDMLVSPQVTVRLLRHARGRLPRVSSPGPADLSARETEVARLAAQGRANADIAAELVISTGTVKTHVANIATKLGVRNRVGIAACTREHGIAQPSEYT